MSTVHSYFIHVLYIIITQTIKHQFLNIHTGGETVETNTWFSIKTPHLPPASPHLPFEPWRLCQTQRYWSCHNWLLSWGTSLLAADLPPPWRPSLWRCCVAARRLRFQSCWWSVGTDRGCSRCLGGPSPGHRWCMTLCNVFSLKWEEGKKIEKLKKGFSLC